MSGPGYISPKTFVLAANSAQRFRWNVGSAPWSSMQLYRASGVSDATFRIWTSNFSERDIPGAQAMGNDTPPPVSGSNAYPYWYAEPGASGSCFTGSVTDAPSPFMQHFVDIAAKHIMVEVSSSAGGTFVIYPFSKCL